jgi:hypothetical protein
VYLAVALSAVLVVVAIIDQTGGRSLADHVTAMYAPYGKRPDPNLLYGLVYTVGAIGALLWLPVIRSVRSRRRSAPVLAIVVTTITAALAVLLFVATEYGAQIFPPLWGHPGYPADRCGGLRDCAAPSPSGWLTSGWGRTGGGTRLPQGECFIRRCARLP